MRTHSHKHPYSAHIFTPSLVFINPDMSLENSVRTFLCPFCAYATFIHEAPDARHLHLFSVQLWGRGGLQEE